MTAKLAYDIIMTLQEKERNLLFDMLSPHLEVFELDDIISDENQHPFNNEEMTEYLLKRLFRNKIYSNS